MRRCHSFSARRLTFRSRQPVSCSPAHSSAALASTGTPANFDLHAATAPIHNASSTFPTSISSFTSVAVRHPITKLQHAHTLTVLHTARELIARILRPQSLELSFWNDVLCDVSNEISRSNLTSEEDKVTIVVYPVDEFSGGESLVSALLQDPFSPEVESLRIMRRWEGHEQNTKLDIEYSADPMGETKGNAGSHSVSDVLRLSSSFLASIPSPVRVTELRPTRELSQDNLRLLYKAHIPIILLNPLTTPLNTLSLHASSSKQTVLPFSLPPHALLLITSPSPISTSSSIPPTVFELGVNPDRVFLVDPDRALSSIRSLHANPSDVLHVQRYSDDALASGLSRLKRQLQSIPTPEQKGQALVSAAVSMLRGSLDGDEAELRKATALVRTLRSEISQEREDAHRAVFGPAPVRALLDHQTLSERPSSPSNVPRTSPARPSDSDNKVRDAMARAEDSVLPVLSNMTWWRVLWTPDEVGWRMRQATRDAWVGTIAHALLPALAALPNTQSLHASRALSLARSALPTTAPTLRSPLLLNALSQLAHAPSFAVTPRALLRPLERRIARLDAGTTSALARAAQVLLLRVAGSVGGGVVMGAAVLAQGVGEAAGAGLLVAAVGVRWAIGRWDKARKMWRADWVRVKKAAERDVEAALDQALENQVLIVPVRAAEGIEGIVAKREDEMRQLRQEVDKLDAVISDSQKLAHRNPDHG